MRTKNQFIVTETPHRGSPLTWTAKDRDDFCIKVMSANPKGEWSPDWSFDEFVSYLRTDLAALDIMED